jgi:hypothetical protein
MSIRFITKQIHAYLDYPVAFSLMALPFLLSLGRTNSMALWLSVAAGVAALVLTIFTDHQFGLIRVIPYGVHLAVDMAVGVVFLAAPSVFGFTGVDAMYYWINGAAVATVIALHKPESKLALA